MGEMTGEMKNAGSLYLKGSTPSDGRDGPLFVNTPSLSVNNASLISNNPALFALNPILFCARCSLTGNYLFPLWEQKTPSLGTKHSLRGNQQQVPCSKRAGRMITFSDPNDSKNNFTVISREGNRKLLLYHRKVKICT
jgi:hypothetical protein